MSTAGRSADAPDRVAAALCDADFVRLVATADGDALAATGLLARALEEREVPYQATLAAVPELPATGADYTVAVGHSAPASDVTIHEPPLSVAAVDVARELASGAVDAVLALAGAMVAGFEPSGALLEAAALDRHPGVAVPTDDLVEGLAVSTLVHAGFSDDTAAVEATLSDIDDGRELASFVALSAVQNAPQRAAEAVERALYPYECDRFETLGGFADVLDVVARERPGTGIALALGHDVETAALETWRVHGRRVHAALREADTRRYSGVYAVQTEASVPLGPVARLCFEYRSPEPAVIAVADGRAAVAGDRSAAVEDALCSAATTLDGRATVRRRDGVTAIEGAATFDGTDEDYLEAFRTALPTRP